MTELHLWLRHEPRTTERRTPVVPSDARRLVENGVTLTVEESPQRIFPIEEYEAIGARVAPADSWASAPRDTVILGLKELPDKPTELTHRHIFFGHAYKGQLGASDLLSRFEAGAERCSTSNTWWTTTDAASPRSASGRATWARRSPSSSTGADWSLP